MMQSMKKLFMLLLAFTFLFLVVACNDDDDVDDNDVTNGNGDHVDNGDDNDNDNDFVGDPYLYYDVTKQVYEWDSWVTKFVREGPFDIEKSQEVFTDRAISEGMEPIDISLDFGAFGYPSETLSNTLYFESEHYLSIISFKAIDEGTEVSWISVWRALYYLPNTMEAYLDFLTHPSGTEVISESIVGNTNIEVFARSDMDIEEIMLDYVDHFNTEGWLIQTNSLIDEDNFFYDRDDRFQLVVQYDQDDVSFNIWIDITTPYHWEDHYKEGHSFITITIENVARYLHEE